MKSRKSNLSRIRRRRSGATAGSHAQPTALNQSLLTQGVSLLGGQDRLLGSLVEKYGLPPLWDRPPGFATLVHIILEQQVSLASAAALFRRLETEMGGALTPQAVAKIGSTGLRELGVTRQKSRYLSALADEVLHGRLDLVGLMRMSDDEVTERLTSVTGIGPWTASIYLLMALLRPDVWPTGDLALNRVLTELKGRAIASSEASTIAERWRPWRAVAARILWHGYLSGRANPVGVPDQLRHP